MKINVEIDCTPAEAREFYGLPDVRELQANVLRRLEERLMSRLDALSPEAVLQNWFAFNANGARAAREEDGVVATMKILVPVKRVVDYNIKIRIKSDGSRSRKRSVRRRRARRRKS